jgi:hypothetical protein
VLVREEREAMGDLSSMMAFTEDKARRRRHMWARLTNRQATGQTGRRRAQSVSSTGHCRGARALRGVGRVGRGPDQISVGMVL